MNRTVWTLVRKELSEALRDRKVLLMSIVVPVAIYPLMMGVTNSMEKKETAKTQAEVADVVLTGNVDLLLPRVEADSTLALGVVTVPPDSLRSMVEAGELDAWLDAPDGLGRAADGEVATVSLYYDQTESVSRDARRRLEAILRDVRDEQRELRYEAAGGDGRLDALVVSGDADIATESEATGAEAGRMLVYVLLMMLFMSGANFSGEQVAGEKERGTLETLFLIPAPRHDIARAKVIFVSFGTVLTALLSLASLVFTYQQGWASQTGEAFSFDALSLVFITLLVIPLAVLVGSILLAISTVARTLKEAQSYLLPAMLVVFVPAIMSLSQGIELKGIIALIPVANVAFAMRDLLAGRVDVTAQITVVLATLVWAGLLVRYVGNLLSREEMVLGFDPEPFLARTPSGRMRALQVGMVATTVAYFYAGNLLQTWDLQKGLLLSLWALLPVLGIAVYRVAHHRGAFLETLSLRLPPATAWLAALCFGVGLLLPMMNGVARLQSRVLPMPEDAMAGLDVLQDLATWKLLFLVALSPAIWEEFVFRGIFLGMLRKLVSVRNAILISSAFFALIHLSVFRFVPTFLLGVVMATLVWRSRSLLPAVLLHFVYNGSLVVGSRIVDGLGVTMPLDGAVAWTVSVALLAVGALLVRGLNPMAQHE